MCTIAILIGVAEHPVVLAANRDELYARPTRPPERLTPDLVAPCQGSADDAQRVVGGVDVQSGGTWLALHRRGRFAAVTNQRDLQAKPANVRSRGLAVKELALAEDQDAYVAELDPRAYASMNLVWGDASAVSIAYVRHEGDKELVRLPRGIHVLTNDRLGSPEFPRAARIEQAIAAAPHDWGGLAAALATILADHQTFHVAPPPLAPPPLRHHLAPLTATCIHTPQYGTRSSSLVALEPGRIAHYLHADGPPCTTPYADLGALVA